MAGAIVGVALLAGVALLGGALPGVALLAGVLLAVGVVAGVPLLAAGDAAGCAIAVGLVAVAAGAPAAPVETGGMVGAAELLSPQEAKTTSASADADANVNADIDRVQPRVSCLSHVLFFTAFLVPGSPMNR